MREMILVGFLQAQNCSNFAGSWRHPDSRNDFSSPDYYAHIGRVLEAGKFHLAFFDDRLGMPEFHGGRYAEAVAHGIRCVKMDPIACLMPMAMGTTRLGLGATYSTTYYHPFHVARLFQTLDLMTRGRAAWNVVTSMNDIEAQNMGLEELVEHDARTARHGNACRNASGLPGVVRAIRRDQDRVREAVARNRRPCDQHRNG